MIDYKKIAFKSRASQDKFELWKLLELLSINPPKKILEIGVDKGYLCQTWREAFPEAYIVGIDNNPEALDFFDFKFVDGDSHDVDLRNGVIDLGPQYDLIFIDGDHSLKGVTDDYEMYGALISPGGVIAFHDIMRDPERIERHKGVEVRQLFNEIKQRHASVEIWNGAAGDDGPGIGCVFL